MSKKNEIYCCEICGSMVEVINGGGGTLVCCNKPMTLLKENSVDAATEKHIPVVEKINGGVNVKVGSVTHPMEEKHYIEWIELITTDGTIFRKELNPGESPEATFKFDGEIETVREYCNIHGLWKTK
ncbi:desulfoferrodoxin [Clostridium gasigenes]|uniref:desulfoferrodoxin n=1 Tax=Clostridium gasigenes TaxID=94869 RepID=UPI001625417B|nr:desulfoferrodoxin [Clostridium gasigenes]MBB6623115.1 desulfoferrodoxin [Clostridium gasigenes]MBU3087885.1 desulfoferrodoxin [Clostridium gasigenes]MBU3135495.1 desulfoferrodoxin [Clostridium gasigenes]